MNRKDILLVVIILAVAGLGYVLFERPVSGNIVVITLDGNVYGTYRLDDTQNIMVKSEEGYNQIQISDGMVSIVDADCPDQYCVKQGKTSNQHKSLICLPHKLVVEVQLSSKNKRKTDDVDVIAQ